MSETIHDAAAAYALGILDPDEARAFEAHLSGCERCRAEVASFEETVARVGSGVAEVPPPPALKSRVMEAARATAAPGAATASASPAPAESSTPPSEATPDRGRIPWWGLAAAAVAAITTVGWWNARQRSDLLEIRVDELSTAVEIRNRAIEERDSLLDIALDLEARDARLVATDLPPSARLVWSPERRRVILSVADLAPAPEGRTYQLWGIPEGEDPVSLGLFDTNPDGGGIFVLTVPEDIEFAVGAVTEEPAGGSPQPTTTPFLVGAVTE